jgi:hypothetical protein
LSSIGCFPEGLNRGVDSNPAPHRARTIRRAGHGASNATGDPHRPHWCKHPGGIAQNLSARPGFSAQAGGRPAEAKSQTMPTLIRSALPARLRARLNGSGSGPGPGPAWPQGSTQAERKRRAEMDAAVRWIEARDGGLTITRLRRMRQTLVRWLNRFDGPVVYPWSRSLQAHGVAHELHRTVAGLKSAGQGGRLVRIRRTIRDMIWPLVATSIAIPVLLRCGPRVRNRYGYSIGEQWRDVWEAIWLHGIMPTEYYQRRVFRGNAVSDKSLYLREQEIGTLLEAAECGGDSSRINHVCRFVAECRAAGLPVVKPAAVFTGGSVDFSVEGGSPGLLPEKDLLLRPEKWTPGEHGQLWRWNPQRRVWSFEDRSFATDGLLGFCRTLSHRRPWVLLEAVHCHPEMARFTAGGLSIVRLATGIETSGNSLPLFASMRLQSVTSGGRVCGVLTSGIEIESGVLTPAWGESMADGEFESHPDSGSVIAGAVVPYWSEIVDLAIRAHQRFSDVPFIAWEITVGGSGPVLLEASTNLGTFDHVLPSETAFADLCLQRLETIKNGPAGATTPVTPPAAVASAPVPVPESRATAGRATDGGWPSA